jgi:hypothetical protein
VPAESARGWVQVPFDRARFLPFPQPAEDVGSLPLPHLRRVSGTRLLDSSRTLYFLIRRNRPRKGKLLSTRAAAFFPNRCSLKARAQVAFSSRKSHPRVPQKVHVSSENAPRPRLRPSRIE